MQILFLGKMQQMDCFFSLFLIVCFTAFASFRKKYLRKGIAYFKLI